MNICNLALGVGMMLLQEIRLLAIIPLALFLLFYSWVLEIEVSKDGVTVRRSLLGLWKPPDNPCFFPATKKFDLDDVSSGSARIDIKKVGAAGGECCQKNLRMHLTMSGMRKRSNEEEWIWSQRGA